MRIVLDCPICNVFMRPKSKNTVRGFVCPVCGSRFIVNNDPRKREWINGQLDRIGAILPDRRKLR